MKQLVSVNLTTRAATDWTPPTIAFGEELTLALRLYKQSEGEEVEASIEVSSLTASYGRPDARPESGKVALKVGPAAQSAANTTEALPHSAQPSEWVAALNGLETAATYGQASARAADGSLLITFGDGSAQVPLAAADNTLWPASFARVAAKQIDGKWVHEVRFIQAPVAFTSSHETVLPPAPEITRIQAGGADGTFEWNEIQQIYVPAEFRGSYIIKMGLYAKTSPLSREDGTDAIRAALQALGADCWKVTLPLSNRPTIEFVGDYAGAPHDLLVAQVDQAPAGDLSFTVDFGRAELAELLRSREQVTLPLEVRINGEDDSGAATNLALALDVTVRRPVWWAELAEVPQIDWLRPLSPKTYIPFGANQVLSGNKYYAEAIGDGSATEFVLATGLAGELVYVFVRENVSGGRLLVNGTDYSATIDSDNEVTISAIGEAPGASAWMAVVASAQAIAQWATDLTVTVPQVVAGSGYPSLPDFMENALERLDALEAVLPSTGPGATSDSGAAWTTKFPAIRKVLFYRGAAEVVDADGPVAESLPRVGPYLLPAIHDATTETLPTPLPSPSGNAGKVYENGGAAAVIVPTGGMIPSGTVAVGGFAGCDGRALYPVTRGGSTNSYYPSAMEIVLGVQPINDKQLRVGRTLEILWAVQLQLLKANCQAQWVLVAEIGTIAAESSPSPVGLNLENVEWSSTPIFEQPIVLGPNLATHAFGLRIQRLAGGLSLDQAIYGVWEGNDDAAPATANFVARIRLSKFDTENNQPLPRGHVYLAFLGAPESFASSEPTEAATAKIYS